MGNIDSIPILSQVKSLFQVISGDAEGAKRTQENFRDTAIIVSQVTSLAHAISGNEKAALDVQKKFAKTSEAMIDSIPVVGHIKGGIHYALGQNERGDHAMKSATGSWVVAGASVAGTLVGGPAGGALAAAAASQAYNGIVTGVETAIKGKRKNGSPRYHGSWETFHRMSKEKADSGEIFDGLIDIPMDMLGGATVGKVKGGFKGFIKKVGTTVADDIPGSGLIRKSVKKISSRRCKRDIEYQLTADETEFATSHQALPGSMEELLRKDWHDLNVNETVSNLVSLFVILRLILWNDKQGRSYSSEVCSFTAGYDEIEKCQIALANAIRQIENHLSTHADDVSEIIEPKSKIILRVSNRTVVMIDTMVTLYGIMSSISRGQSNGTIWLRELCMYENILTYRLCEKEVALKLFWLGEKALLLGEDRKYRVKRGSCKKRKPDPSTSTNSKRNKNINVQKLRPSEIDRPVGTYIEVRESVKKAYDDYVQKNNLKSSRDIPRIDQYEVNHIPALSTIPGAKRPGNNLVAHVLPYHIHQTAMGRVGSSGGRRVPIYLRKVQKEFIKRQRMGEAIKLDFSFSYGRANIFHETSISTGRYKPALIEYQSDLHKIIDLHKQKRNIDSTTANNLHHYLDMEVICYNTFQRDADGAISSGDWQKWFYHEDKIFRDVIDEEFQKSGGRVFDPRYMEKVPDEDRVFG